LTDSGRSEKKCRKRKEKPKFLQVAGTLVPRQKAVRHCARERLHLKVPSWGGGKRSQLFENATFFLPSVSCRVLRSPVLILFLNFKLENVAIKLVEIALEKHKFPNVFVKKGKFGQKKHCCLLHR
jgi:hypothetical protein